MEYQFEDDMNSIFIEKIISDKNSSKRYLVLQLKH